MQNEEGIRPAGGRVGLGRLDESGVSVEVSGCGGFAPCRLALLRRSAIERQRYRNSRLLKNPRNAA
jgi:hypothetical protein